MPPASPLGPTLIPALNDQFHRGDIVELQGPAASGKSHLLYYMLINCVLHSSKLSGWGKAAILFDTDHKFDVRRFAQLLRSRARRLLPMDSPALDAIVTKALDSLHVFQPSSSHQLTATIHHLPAYLATNLPDADLGILAIDSITAFHWPDRYNHEQIRSANANHASLRSLNPSSHVFTSLRSLTQSHGPLILLSNWDLSPSSTSHSRQSLDSSTSALLADPGLPWQHQLSVSYRITLSIPSISIDGNNSTNNKDPKAKPSNATTFLSGTVRTPGSSKVTQFALHITEDDILVS